MSKYLNIPTFILLALLARILYMGAGFGEALGLLALAGLYAFHLFLEEKRQPQANKDLWDRLIALEENNKVIRDKVNSFQIANSLKR